MLADADVPVVVDARLRERDGVERVDQRITRIATVDGREYGGRVFIDATYEGDLMAQAGISFTVGREASSRYGESLAGVRPPQQELPVMPATTAGGSLAPGVDAGPLGAIGSADRHVQPYNFRLCVTTERANQVPFPRPDGYDPSRYLLVQRHLQALEDAGRTPVLANVVTINPIPDQKADLNAAGPLSTDLLGGSDEYPTASYAQREAIWAEHYRYQAGLLYFLTHDASVPDSIAVRSMRGASAATSSPTVTTGRRSYTCARRGGWSPTLCSRRPTSPIDGPRRTPLGSARTASMPTPSACWQVRTRPCSTKA